MTALPRMKIHGKVYTLLSPSDLKTKDVLALQQESAQCGFPLLWSDVERMAADDDRSSVDSMLLGTVMIWATLRQAGDPISYDEALELGPGDVEEILPPGDHQEPANPTRARKGKGSAKKKNSGSRQLASAPAPDSDSSRADLKAAPTSTTSEPLSVTA